MAEDVAKPTQRYAKKPAGRRPGLRHGDYKKDFHKTMSYYGTVREFHIKHLKKSPDDFGVQRVINVYARTTREYPVDPKYAIPVSKKLIEGADQSSKPPGAGSDRMWREDTAWYGGKRSAQKATRRGGRREARRKALKVGVRTGFPLRIPSISKYI